MRRWTGRWLVLVATVLIVVGLFGGRFVSLYIEYLWFEAIGASQVFAVQLLARLALFIAGAVVFLGLFVPNVLGAQATARRLLRRAPMRVAPARPRKPFDPFGTLFNPAPGEDAPRPFAELGEMMGGQDGARWLIERGGVGRWLTWAAGLALALLMGLAAAGKWEILLRAANATPFGATEPIFDLDIGFYVFTLPALDTLQSWLFWAILLTLFGVGLVYLLALYALDPSLDHLGLYLTRPARGLRNHLLWLTALLLLVAAAGTWVGLFEYLFEQHNRLPGPNYTDVHVRIPATQALIAAMVLTALLVAATTFRTGYWLPLTGVVLTGTILVVGRGILPLMVQRLQVEPAELARERPYIAYGISATRQAYGLGRVEELTLPAEEAVRAEEIRANADTVTNIRLWDPQLLKSTYNQVQSIRPYYVFDDVDVDRYRVDGRYRQVMLSARELVTAQLGAQAQTWVNRRLQYTHGYGLAMSPVNEVSPEGLPVLFVRDLPPAGRVPVTRPEVYYGEQTDAYVIVNTNAQEFDYPRGEQNEFTNYAAASGVPVGPIWRRLLLSWYLGDFNLLVSGYVRPDSRVLFRRDVRDRVQRVAPFLKLDGDPYLVVADGQLVWLVDGYTTSDHYPYSQPLVERLGAPAPSTAGAPGGTGPTIVGRRFTYNYIRNSVKVSVNAYDGSVRVYLADPSDPVALTYTRIFPGLFVSIDEMPAALRAHVRYPEDLFRAQAQILRAYHVQDPQVFYNGEDVWSFAFETGASQRQIVEPYYLIMRLPGEAEAEFVLVMPFTPLRRDNMTAWLAARMDGAEYGNLRLYKFPRDRLVFGPAQIQARMDQDPVISSQLTLWNQQGSRVERGNLLVIPIGNSTLYVQPIYLLAERSQLPELKRVVLATGSRLVMEPTLEEGLLRLFGPEAGVAAPGDALARPLVPALPTTTPPGASPPRSPVTSPGAPTQVLDPATAAAVREAREAYDRAQAALRAGDFAQFGEALKQLERALNQLEPATPPPQR